MNIEDCYREYVDGCSRLGFKPMSFEEYEEDFDLEPEYEEDIEETKAMMWVDAWKNGDFEY